MRLEWHQARADWQGLLSFIPIIAFKKIAKQIHRLQKFLVALFPQGSNSVQLPQFAAFSRLDSFRIRGLPKNPQLKSFLLFTSIFSLI